VHLALRTIRPFAFRGTRPGTRQHSWKQRARTAGNEAQNKIRSYVTIWKRDIEPSRIARNVSLRLQLTSSRRAQRACDVNIRVVHEPHGEDDPDEIQKEKMVPEEKQVQLGLKLSVSHSGQDVIQLARENNPPEGTCLSRSAAKNTHQP